MQLIYFGVACLIQNTKPAATYGGKLLLYKWSGALQSIKGIIFRVMYSTRTYWRRMQSHYFIYFFLVQKSLIEKPLKVTLNSKLLRLIEVKKKL